MVIKKLLGWTFLTIGISLMIIPFISGFTGYFAITSFSILPQGTNFEITHTVIGVLLAVFGYHIIRSRKEHILS